MNIVESAYYCKEYAQVLPPEYSVYAWLLWFTGILIFALMFLQYAKDIQKRNSN